MEHLAVYCINNIILMGISDNSYSDKFKEITLDISKIHLHVYLLTVKKVHKLTGMVNNNNNIYSKSNIQKVK